MLRASVYIIRCAAANQLRRRLRRLKEPRYLFGALVGAGYLYFAIFGRFRLSRRSRRPRPVPLAFLPLANGTGPIVGGVSMLAASVLSLLLPVGSGLLAFSRTESDFLFASPLSSRQLLIYRLLRSQIGVLFSALIVALTYPLASPGVRLRGFIASWIVLLTAQLFFAGVAVTRTVLPRPSWRARLVALVPRLFLAASAATLLGDAYATMMAEQGSVESAWAVLSLIGRSAADGWSRVVLWPFMALLAPLFATTQGEFVRALPAAALVSGVVMAWVLSADEAFDELRDRLAQGYGRAAESKVAYRARPPVWRLGVRGPSELVFLWKTANQIARGMSRSTLFKLVLSIVWVTLVLMLFASRGRGLTQVGGIFAAIAAAFAVVFGPQMVRYDLRQDLQHLELLKTWPVRAASVIRGQILGATVVVTLVAWGLGLVAFALSAAAFPKTVDALRVAAGLASLIAVPALVMAQFTVHNAAALLLPAWFGSSGTRPRGIDAMGQRLIMLAGTWIVLVAGVLPAVLVGGMLWWLFEPAVGPWILIPAAVVGTLMVAAEVGVVAEALAPAYEQLDITGIERDA